MKNERINFEELDELGLKKYLTWIKEFVDGNGNDEHKEEILSDLSIRYSNKITKGKEPDDKKIADYFLKATCAAQAAKKLGSEFTVEQLEEDGRERVEFLLGLAEILSETEDNDPPSGMYS